MIYPLNKSEIINNLLIDANIITVKETGSTNTDLKKLAESGASEWSVLCADKQISGRGRTGNSFYSPENGIYMSILLKPDFSPEDSLFITTLAACSVCRAIEKISDKQVKIKWVNDIYTKDGKICGILTESSINYVENKFNYAILGIGLNITEPINGFPIELQGKAVSLFYKNECDSNIKNQLIAEILNQFYNLYNNFDKEKHVKEYKHRSLLINKEIIYNLNGEETHGKVMDIDNECRLIISNTSGQITKLSSGEVKIKKWLEKAE